MDFSHPYRLVLEGENQGLSYTRGESRLVPFELPGRYDTSLFSPLDGTLIFGSHGDRGGGLTVYTPDGKIVLQNFYDDIPLALSINKEGNYLLLSGKEEAILLERGFW